MNIIANRCADLCKNTTNACITICRIALSISEFVFSFCINRFLFVTTSECVQSYLASFASGDPEQIAAHVTDAFENNQMSVLAEGCRGRETYKKRLAAFLSNFANLRYQIEEMIVAADRVAVAYQMNAREGEAEIEIHGVMLLTVTDGLISKRSDYWDGLTYQQQAGV